MRDVSRSLFASLSGYYEDFASLRVMATGKAYDSLTDYGARIRSHQGNTLSSLADNNPRWSRDIFSRLGAIETGLKVIDGSDYVQNYSPHETHNEGPGQWLTNDPYSALSNSGFISSGYANIATLTVPDTITDAASLRWLTEYRRADFSRFASGWGTQNSYWVRHGDTDGSFNHRDFDTSTAYYNKYEMGRARTGTPATWEADLRVMHNTNIAGVFMGEGLEETTSSGIGVPHHYFQPIKSPSGKPFLTHHFARRLDDWYEYTAINNVGGKKQYVVDADLFKNSNTGDATDSWFAFKFDSTTFTTTETYTAGVAEFSIPKDEIGGVPLNPSLDHNLPARQFSEVVHKIVVGGDTHYYKQLVDDGANYVFKLQANTSSSYSTPSITLHRAADTSSSDATIVLYNQYATLPPLTVFGLALDTSTTTYTPNPYPTLLLGPNKASGLTYTDSSATAVSSTTACPWDPSLTLANLTTYKMTLTVGEATSGLMRSDGTALAYNDGWVDFTGTFGTLGVGDYITVQGQTAPEKVTAVAGNLVTTDGTYSATGTGYLRSATYGSYYKTNGRPKDGLMGFEPVVVGDAELNSKSDGESFKIRMAVQSFDNSSTDPTGADMVYRLAVGYNKTESDFSLNERGNMAGTEAAITHTFRLSDGTGLSASRLRLFNEWSGSTNNTYTSDQLWFDFEFVADFTAQTYKIYYEGTLLGSGSFNAKTGGGDWDASDLYGWSLGVQIVDGRDASATLDWVTVVTMIDSAGWFYDLNERADGADEHIINGFSMMKVVDGISRLELEVVDDDNTLSLPQLQSNRPDWRVLLYRDSNYRPIWSGLISDVEFNQDAKSQTKTINIRARDAMQELDFQFPYFDIGQAQTGPSLLSSYLKYQVEAYSRAFHFGASSLIVLNQYLGLDKYSVSSDGEYLPRYDQRTRLHSAHPIQMYLNDDTNGPNDAENQWEVSRLVSYIKADPDNPTTKSILVLDNDAISGAKGVFNSGIKVSLSGTWDNPLTFSKLISGVGTKTAVKTPPYRTERGYLSIDYRNNIETPHNDFRGEHTISTTQAWATASDTIANTITLSGDYGMFPTGGGNIGLYLNPHTGSFALTTTYTSRSGAVLSGVADDAFTDQAPRAQGIYNTDTPFSFRIDTAWRRSLKVTRLKNVGGKLALCLRGVVYAGEGSGSYSRLPNDSTNQNPYYMLARNERLIDPATDATYRIWGKANGSGNTGEEAALTGVFYTGTVDLSVEAPIDSSDELIYTTDIDISSLPASSQAILTSDGDYSRASASDVGNGMEGDLSYVTRPKNKMWSLAWGNTPQIGSLYNYRNLHARWIRDLPQSVWFQKEFGRIRKAPYAGWTNGVKTLEANFDTATDTTITLNAVANLPSAGVGEIWTYTADGDTTGAYITSFTYQTKTNSTKKLNNVKFADKTQGVIKSDVGDSTGKRRVVIRDIESDYKHIWVMWADMRNDGSADADGGTREDDFGLIYPVADNYSLSVVWAESGIKFADLKLGEDADLWNISANTDPATGMPWSDNPTAVLIDYDSTNPIVRGDRSDDTEINSMYHDWEGKGGAFVVIDLSKFFNLNTEASGGRVGQSAGGNKTLGDLIVESSGEPELIDSFWYHAASNSANSATPIPEHYNSSRWLNITTTIPADTTPYLYYSSPTYYGFYTYIEVIDTSGFPAKMGVGASFGLDTAGVIEAGTLDANGNSAVQQYVFSYTDKTATKFNGTKYRAVQQGEDLATAAAGLWADDTYTHTGRPSMLKDGTTIRGSLGSDFPFGFMLQLVGDIKAPAGGSYAENDKLRILSMGSLLDDSFNQTVMPALSDIQNTPILRDYNATAATVQSGATTGSVETFGSVYDARGKSILATLRAVSQESGVGDGGSLLTLNFLMGRDNRLELRPSYNSGFAFTRDNLKVSNLATSKAATFTHIRVMYNGGLSFVDYPEPEYGENRRTKLISAVKTTSYDEAYQIARREYNSRNTPAFQVEAEVIRESGETQRTGPMLANARYGYIADPCRQTSGPNGGFWTSPKGGSPFPGVQSALKGNISGYGLSDDAVFGTSDVFGMGIGGYIGADNFTTTYGSSNLYYPSRYFLGALDQFYYWVGSNSISNAVQIVHIPKGMPSESETTGEELRICVGDYSGEAEIGGFAARMKRENALDKQFKVFITDFAFSNTSVGVGYGPTKRATEQLNGSSHICFKGNGFYEIDVPASYWAAGAAAGFKIVISVNADYLNAVARHKAGEDMLGNYLTTTMQNYNQVITGGGTTNGTSIDFPNSNEFSIFPLGFRNYPELGSYATYRTAYYAPRIHITDDMNFHPGTYITYTDAYLGINEALYVSEVDYTYSARNLGKTAFVLERELNRMPEGIEGYLRPNIFDSPGGQGPPTGGGGGSGSGSGINDQQPVSPGQPDEGGKPIGDDNTPPKLNPGLFGQTGAGTYKGINRGIHFDFATGNAQEGQRGSQASLVAGSNQLSAEAMGRIDDRLGIDTLLPDGKQAIPGQKKPQKVGPKVRTIDGIDTKFLATNGFATETSNGWVLPGVGLISGESPGVTNRKGELVMQGSVPMDASHPLVGVVATVSVDLGPSTNQTVELTTTIECPDTSESLTYTQTVPVTSSSISRQKVSLVPLQQFAAANTSGRTLKVTISRIAGEGNDDADYGSLVIHNVQLETKAHNIQALSDNQRLKGFSGSEVNETDTTNNSIDVTTDADTIP